MLHSIVITQSYRATLQLNVSSEGSRRGGGLRGLRGLHSHMLAGLMPVYTVVYTAMHVSSTQ